MDIVELADLPEAGGFTPALRQLAPSLALEGGPMPWDVLPDPALHHVAFLTGYFARNAPRPAIPDAPRVRPFQLAQLRVCVPWFARLLD